MAWFRFAALVVVATILQTSFIGAVWILSTDIRPDLLVILLVFFAIRCDSNDAVLTSFIIGFAADLAYPASGFMGPRIISFGLFGTLLNNLHNVISIRRFSHQAVAILAMGLATPILTQLLAHLRTDPAPLNIVRELFWQPVFSALVGPFLSLPMAWWMQMSGRRRRRSRGKSLMRYIRR
ncbi:MAG: rod shape-determining protein MreD [Planctomycetota bacterium]|jgi:rod shape-determining protein MreD